MKKRFVFVSLIICFVLCLNVFCVISFAYTIPEENEEYTNYTSAFIQYLYSIGNSEETINTYRQKINQGRSSFSNFIGSSSSRKNLLNSFEEIYYNPEPDPEPTPTPEPDPDSDPEETDINEIRQHLSEIDAEIDELNNIIVYNDELNDNISEKLDTIIIGLSAMLDNYADYEELFTEQNTAHNDFMEDTTEKLGVMEIHLDNIELLTGTGLANLHQSSVSGNDIIETRLADYLELAEEQKVTQEEQYEEQKEIDKNTLIIIIASIGVVIGGLLGLLVNQWFKRL